MSQCQTSENQVLATAQHYWQSLSQANDQNWTEKQSQQIKTIFGLSDFVAQSCIENPWILEQLLQHGLLEANKLDFAGLLAQQLSQVESELHLQQALRQFRRLHMVRLAWRDLSHIQDIEQSLLEVSELANELIKQSYSWLYKELCDKYGTPEGEFGPQPLFIIGMGKLGGEELNFSSDIDLIFAYPSQGETIGGKKPLEHQQFFTRLAQKLIAALHQITVDGQVFRVDMRLRPFGDSGPLVMHFDALEDYYQEQGREWERYAMLKGRIINDDGPYKEQLRDILRPFVFRRYIDFSAIDSLRKMKLMINQEVRRRGLVDNIKLGAGGIREVEFIVQSFQLIRGGREPQLQHPSLLYSLEQLVQLHILPAEDATKIRESYLFLRKTEHYLQQFADQQTQLLPQESLNQQRLCELFKCKDYDSFKQQVAHHCHYINGQFQLLIGDEQANKVDSVMDHLDEVTDLWQLDLETEEARLLLATWLQAENAEVFYQASNEFKQTITQRRLGQRGQDTLHKLMPLLLLGTLQNGTLSAEQLLPRLFRVIQSIIGRTTYLELLYENPGALKQLIKLCAASPWIAEQISRFPLLLDELLNPAELYNPTALDKYDSELRQAMLRIDPEDLEQQMEALRQFKLSEQLKIAAADVEKALAIMKVSDHLTYLAEALIKTVVNIAWLQMTEKYGSPTGKNQENKGFAVIAYGKLGGLELGYGSDLDLVFVHNCDSSQETDGEKAIGSQAFYIKLAQRVMHLFATKTASGQLYEVDMRLRPSGNAGLLVCHINSFAEYQQQQAWTWEHQALVRARFIYGDQALLEQFTQIRANCLQVKRELTELADQVVKMREKMREHLAKGTEQEFDIKQDLGGITDIEFLVQYWVLANAHQFPNLTRWPDNVRILEMLGQFELIDQQDADLLTQAYLEYRNASHRLALQQRAVMENSTTFELTRQHVKGIWQNTFKSVAL
jgi:[glutamine synthetase] adenylyltransferase / [glutamine synthetase]-adenylyl-L-tyrosine phosphorylase